MLKLSRILISALGAAFGTLLTSFVVLHIHHFRNQQLVYAAIFSYLVVLFTTLFAFRSVRIPSWLAVVALAVTAWVPFVMNDEHVGPANGDWDTFWVTGNAILLSAIAVRGYQLLAALGGVGLLCLVIYFGGASFIPASGIVGAELLVGTSIAISIGLDRASTEIENVQSMTLAVEAGALAAQVARDEHARQVSRLKSEVTPTLNLIASGKKLTKAQRQQIAELETQLRDEVAGGRLITNPMREAIDKARANGVEVEVLDQGGTVRVSDSELAELLSTVVIAIASANPGDRIRLSAPAEANYVLHLTKTRPGVVTPDLDLKLGEGLV